jgi:hypothetical protein
MTKMELNEKIRVSYPLISAVTALVSVVVLVAGGAWAASELKTSLDGKADLQSLREAALEEAMQNPGHRVPDPRDPTRIIVVELERTKESHR